MDRIRGARLLYLAGIWGVVVALLAQVSLVSLWLFDGQATLWLHKEFGHLITIGVLALLVLAYAGQLPRPTRLATLLLTGLMAIQTEVFAFLPRTAVRAFHPVLALVIFSLAALLAYQALPLARERPMATTVPGTVVKS